MDVADIIVIVFGIAGTVVGILGWRKAGDANRIAAESNTIAWSSKETADGANRIAVDANTLAGGANRLAGEANEIARESKAVAEDSHRVAIKANDISLEAARVVAEDIEYRRQRELESKRAILSIPDKNPIAWYTSKGSNAVLSLDMVNKGAGEIRDLEMTVFDNESPIEVERGKLSKLTRDDGVDVSRLQFLIYYDTEWATSFQSHVIRAHFDFEDGTGHREDDLCFRFSEAGSPGWISAKVPCI